MKIPTFSGEGYLPLNEHGVDKLLAWFLVTDGYQSTFYSSDIASLPALIALHGDNYPVLENKIIGSLTKLFNNFFETVEIECSVRDIDGSGKITVSGYVIDSDNRTIDLSKVTDLIKSATSKVTEESNNGS